MMDSGVCALRCKASRSSLITLPGRYFCEHFGGQVAHWTSGSTAFALRVGAGADAAVHKPVTRNDYPSILGALGLSVPLMSPTVRTENGRREGCSTYNAAKMPAPWFGGFPEPNPTSGSGTIFDQESGQTGDRPLASHRVEPLIYV
ncbi:hypothetical protein C8R43DRAFT_942802 [Mycena crocata]|nr:hypothetical protein C8R43DRAFT_942802 [Mycena crocata]